jgi:hypothetical protein
MNTLPGTARIPRRLLVNVWFVTVEETLGHAHRTAPLAHRWVRRVSARHTPPTAGYNGDTSIANACRRTEYAKNEYAALPVKYAVFI